MGDLSAYFLTRAVARARKWEWRALQHPDIGRQLMMVVIGSFIGIVEVVGLWHAFSHSLASFWVSLLVPPINLYWIFEMFISCSAG